MEWRLERISFAFLIPYMLTWDMRQFSPDVFKTGPVDDDIHLSPRDEVIEWCNDSFGKHQWGWGIKHAKDDKPKKNVIATFYFRDEADATMFVLRWLTDNV